MTRILVSSFEPFGGDRVNASTRAVDRLMQTPIAGIALHRVVLPTCFGGAFDRLLPEIERIAPDAVLAVGEDAGRSGLRVERVAINLDDARIADNSGRRPIDAPIVAGAVPAYFSTLPVKRVQRAIEAAGVRAWVSNSAGTFVCNHLLFRLLHLAQARSPGMPCGFIHVPRTPSQALRRGGGSFMHSARAARGLAAAVREIGRAEGGS